LILLSRSASEQALGRVQELRDAGADIEIMRADVTSERDVREVIASLKSRFGALQGVIHAAGVPGGGTIALRTAEAVRQVIAPKVEGTRVLYEAVQPMRPDFLMLCSSIAAILGPAGQFDYCAANAFQDAFAHAFDQPDGMRVLSINWDGWRESGMAVRAQSEGNRAAWREALDSALSGDEGAEVFARVLSSPRPQWLVSTRPFAEVTAASSAAQSGTGGTSIAPDFPGARAAVDAHPTETDIAALWSELLGVPIGGSDTDFFAAGGDSLLAVELGTRISGRFGRAIAVRDLISNPTLASMTRLIGLHCVQQL
jgi:NAD(P)-dependent dehydrogenase (short-subunit alcohol dehydrogenase family)